MVSVGGYKTVIRPCMQNIDHSMSGHAQTCGPKMTTLVEVSL